MTEFETFDTYSDQTADCCGYDSWGAVDISEPTVPDSWIAEPAYSEPAPAFETPVETWDLSATCRTR